ncbi:MAG: hypothetical protein KTR31_31210 [Myxococcales bacterium]|nr:hypothetical protein [Myxococcales bacterium]
MYWISILGQDNSGAPGGQELATRWHEAYPTAATPVLGTEDNELIEWAGLPWWPYMILLRPNLKVATNDQEGSVLDMALEVLER